MTIYDKQEITVMGKKYILDPEILKFSDQTLSDYIQGEAGWYAYYGFILANAEAEEQWASAKADEKYDTLFWTYKSEGLGSDKFCESKAKSMAEVVEARQAAIAAKRNVTMLKTFLKALDKNHDNAQSTGHNLRKEMDKLGRDIKGERFDMATDYESKLQEILNK